MARSHAMNPRLFGVNEVALQLSMSRRNVYRLLSTGELRSVKHGGRRLVTETELDRFVQQLATP